VIYASNHNGTWDPSDTADKRMEVFPDHFIYPRFVCILDAQASGGDPTRSELQREIRLKKVVIGVRSRENHVQEEHRTIP